MSLETKQKMKIAIWYKRVSATALFGGLFLFLAWNVPWYVTAGLLAFIAWMIGLIWAVSTADQPDITTWG